PNPAPKQDPRRCNRSRSENDAIAGQVTNRTESLDLDTLHLSLKEMNPTHERMRQDAEVVPSSNLTPEVRARRAYTLPVDLVHRMRSGPCLRGIVRVVARRKPELVAGIEERGLPRRELRSRMTADRHWAVPPMPVVREIEIRLESLERYEALLP